jgi:hypothetical protein
MNDGDIKFTEELRAQAPRAALERLIEKVEATAAALESEGYPSLAGLLRRDAAEARKSL